MENIELFKGIKDIGLDALLGYLGAKPKVFKKGDFVLKKGEKLSNIMVVLVGEVKIFSNYFDGEEIFFGKVSDGKTLGARYVCSGASVSEVNMTAEKQTGVLFIPYKKFVEYNEQIAKWQGLLIKNLLESIAVENVLNTERLKIVEEKSIRDKVLTLLNLEAVKCGGKEFEIPFSREEMANYLCVDRSALSRELSNLQKEKIIEYDRNRFNI